MTLSFSETINGKPSYFIDKIQTGLITNELMDFDEYHDILNKYREQFKVCGIAKPTVEEYYEKVTTIREDESNRWKAGNDIHFVINNRRPNRFQFAPVLKCKNVQKIRIGEMAMTASESCFIDSQGKIRVIYVDDHRLFREDIVKVAHNDGFDTAEDFFDYFNKDFTGKIIHWTDLKY